MRTWRGRSTSQGHPAHRNGQAAAVAFLADFDVGASGREREDRLDCGVVVVSETRERTHLEHVELSLLRDDVIANVDSDDPDVTMWATWSGALLSLLNPTASTT